MITGKKKLDSADMKHKIDIKRPAVPVQSTISGEWTYGEPTVLLTTWAAVNNLSGDEYWTAREAQAEKTLIFKLFYAPILENLDSHDFLEWNGKQYDITFPDNMFYENNIVKIKAEVRT